MTPEELTKAGVAIDRMNKSGVLPNDAELRLLIKSLDSAMECCIILGVEFSLAMHRFMYYRTAFTTLQTKRREEQRGYL